MRVHGSYSDRKWVNLLLGHTLNAMGGNAFFWKIKHNILHHTYTNIEGIDDDIAQSRLLRQSLPRNGCQFTASSITIFPLRML
jgi:linoleoyl-CoA desaturase